MSPLGVHVCTFGSAVALIGRAGGGAVGQGPEKALLLLGSKGGTSFLVLRNLVA